MSGRVRVLATPAIAAGFRLAGLVVDTVRPGEDAADRLLAIVARPDLGILIVEQSLLDAVPNDTRRDVERRALPIVVPMPPPAWSEARADAEAYILELLRRAIGYRVRLQ